MNRLILLWACLLAAGAGRGQYNWRLKSESDGIRVFMSSVPDSRIRALKVECSFSATAAQLVAVILDLDACTDWVYRSKLNVLLKRVSPAELYYYSVVDVPWPASDRDFIAHIMVSQNRQSKVVTVNAPCIAGMVPEKNDLVRIRRSSGRWTITPTGGNQIKVEYVLMVDPGGNIPAWLINMFATKGPMESFKNLRLQLQKPAYRQVHFDFIAD